MANETRNERRILGGAVKRLREANRITQDRLATDAGIHFAYLSNVENSKKQPSVDVMCRIANGLGVDLDDISYMATIYTVPESAERLSA